MERPDFYFEGKPKVWNVSERSRGLGDTIAKVAHATGIDTVVRWASQTFGIDCGCEQRQEKLNDFFSYTHNTLE
jgi:hypothetical protein